MTNRDTYGIIGSSGQLEVYADPYAHVTPDDVQSVQDFEDYIHEQEESIGGSFLKIGAALLEVEKRHLYKAAGASSMSVWMKSARFTMSYEHGTRMMRIVRDLVPVLGVDNLPSVSLLKELLPMVNEGATPDQIRETAQEISKLTVKDAKDHIREVRGLEERIPSVVFKARVEQQAIGDESFNKVTITRTGGNDADIYELGRLFIKQKDMARWTDRFGGFLEYE